MKIMKNFPAFILTLLWTTIVSMPLELDMKVRKSNNYRNSILDRLNVSSYLEGFNLNVLKQDILTLEICLGLNKQCFDLVFDTGSYHLWTTSESSIGCSDCKHFDPNLSQSFKNYYKPINLGYVTGSASGMKVWDIVSLGNQTSSIDWMLAEFVTFKVENADGIIGFARDYLNVPKQYQVDGSFSIMGALSKNSSMKYNIFSQKYTNDGKTEAKLFIGDYHEDFYANNTGKSVRHCNVMDFDPIFSSNSVRGMWTCRLSYVIIGDPNQFRQNSNKLYDRAVIDSGSNYIMAPSSFYKILRNYFKYFAACHSETDQTRTTTLFYCDKDFDTKILPKLSFVLNGYAYNIPPEHLFVNFNQSGYNVQLFAIFTMDNLDFWLLGQVFMKNIHILFDNDSGKVVFSAPVQYVADVTMYTTDNDFILSDHIILYILGAGIIVVIIVIFIVWYRKRRSPVIPTSNYSLYQSDQQSGIAINYQYQNNPTAIYYNNPPRNAQQGHININNF